MTLHFGEYPEGCANPRTIPDFFCVYGNPVADFTITPSTLLSVDPSAVTDNNSIEEHPFLGF